MAHISPKPLSEYPWFVRWVLRRQERKYGRVLAPSFLWGRLPGAFLSMLTSLAFFQRKRFPIEESLRSLLSVRIAQLNSCSFCVDLNSYTFFCASGAAEKPEQVGRWRESKLFSDRERAALEYAEVVTTEPGAVDGARMAALRNHFSDDEITALTAWIAFQNMSAKFNAALGAEEHGFCALPAYHGEGS